jgi:coenzyme F420-reducing hydrogenase delta subunit
VSIKDEDVLKRTSFFYGANMMEANQRSIASENVTIFFCQRLDPDQDANRRSLEKELGSRIRFFPLPCSGRIDALHLLKAVETGARKVYVIACPEGACRYGQGNARARKRVGFANALMTEIGLAGDVFEFINAPATLPLSINRIVRDILAGGTIGGDEDAGRQPAHQRSVA